jgi:hypothetical protein
MIAFIINVVAVALALALLAMIAWPIARMIPCIGSSRIAVDIILLLSVAIVFVIIRDYTNIF